MTHKFKNGDLSMSKYAPQKYTFINKNFSCHIAYILTAFSKLHSINLK